MADTDPNTATLADIIRELQFMSLGTEMIVNTLEAFNPVLNSSLALQNMRELNAFIDVMSTVIFDINDGIRDLSTFLTGRQLQEEENRRELIEALNNIGNGQGGPDPLPPPPPPPPSPPRGGAADWLMTLGIATGLGASIGVFAGFFKEITTFFTGANSLIGRVFGTVKNMGRTLLTMFKNFGTSLGQLFDQLKMLFETNRYTRPFADLIKFMRTTSNMGGKIIKKVVDFFQDIANFFVKISKGFTWGAKLGVLLAKVLKVIAYPIVVVTALYATVMGAIDGWKTGGVLGAIKGGISGLLIGVVGSLLDLLKDMASWVAMKLGFEGVASFLDSFSFSAIIKDTVDFVVNLITVIGSIIAGIAEWLGFVAHPLVEKVKGYFNEFMATATQVLEFVGNVFSTMGGLVWSALEALGLDKFVQTAVIDPVVGIFNSVVEYITTMFATAKEAVVGAFSDVGGLADFYKTIIRGMLPDPRDHTELTDPLYYVTKGIPKSIYDYAGMDVTGESPTKSLENSIKANADVQKRVDDLTAYRRSLMSDAEYAKLPLPEKNRIANDFKNLKPSLQPMPSSSGNTLATSTTTNSQPMIINNMGGNVTNTSTSQVNNNSTPFEPIMTGSLMGFSSF